LHVGGGAPSKIQALAHGRIAAFYRTKLQQPMCQIKSFHVLGELKTPNVEVHWKSAPLMLFRERIRLGRLQPPLSLSLTSPR
jgi:hypothetical protein